MKVADLAAEMRQAIAAIEPRDVEQLARFGISNTLIEHFQMVGIARVREDRSGTLYEPDPSGGWAYITPVRVQSPHTPESTQPDVFPLSGNLVDLVAWDEKAPIEWRLRIGTASWLGAVEPQYLEPERVSVWRSPLSWLRNGCTGLVPLARERGEIHRLISSCTGGLVAEDEKHRAFLRDILERPRPSPPVYARARKEDRHAAQ
jgi:hypothetical protein